LQRHCQKDIGHARTPCLIFCCIPAFCAHVVIAGACARIGEIGHQRFIFFWVAIKPGAAHSFFKFAQRTTTVSHFSFFCSGIGVTCSACSPTVISCACYRFGFFGWFSVRAEFSGQDFCGSAGSRVGKRYA
jgi:hypothetical protein